LKCWSEASVLEIILLGRSLQENNRKFHLNSTNWSLGAEHTGHSPGQTPNESTDKIWEVGETAPAIPLLMGPTERKTLKMLTFRIGRNSYI
jgi:hypothetical protein